jgi:hypothetical protein
MKRLTLLVIMVASLAMTNELYAKGSDKGEKSKKERPDKPERDKPERDKPEKEKHEKNIKAEDAQQNWGKLKDEYEDLEKSEQKEKKEEIKVKKRVRNEIRKELERNPDLDLSLIPEYDSNDLEKLVEKLVNDYAGSEVNEETLKALKSAGMSDISVSKIEKSLLKFQEDLKISEELDTSAEDTEKLDVSDEDTEELDTSDEDAEVITV